MPDATIKGPAPGATALLVIDMITDLDFEGGAAIRAPAMAAAESIARLRRDADALGAPVIYVNDNHGQWHSERSRLIEHARRKGGAARELVDRVMPRPDDYFITKPQFSGFYATNLPVLLPQLGVRRLVLTGIAADICILFTAADAHMRDYDLWAPADAVASESAERTRWALEVMRGSMGAETRPTGELQLETWLASA